MKKKLFIGIILAASMLLSNTTLAKSKFITIGTGGITGVYYPTGGAIAKMVNKKRKEYNIRATVESTGGSVFNVNAVVNGDLEFGIVQSDRQYQAVQGLEEWQDKGKQKELRAVFSLHPEAVTLVAALDAGINTLEDVKGKKINIGNYGSGQRQNAIDALKAVRIDIDTDIRTEAIRASEAASLLQDGRIDAFFYTVGHPSGAIKEASSGRRKVHIVDITKIKELLKKSSYYAPVTIPAALYPGAKNKRDIQTFGVKATLVSSALVPNDLVYAVTKEVFENLEEFKGLHPAFAQLTPKNMLEGLSAPLHAGAEKYFKEVGLIK